MRGGGKEKSVGTGQEMEIRRETFFVRMYVVYRFFVLGEGRGRDNFSIREAAANFSYPVPLGWLPLLPSNRRFERIECFSFVIILSLEEKGEKRGMR